MKNAPVLFIVICSLLVLCPLAWQASPCFATYSGGAGTSGDPYQIGSASDLLTLAADTGDYDKYFILTADINLSTSSFTTAVIAIGMYNPSNDFDGTAFTGVFDGDNHKISNLTINTGGLGNDYLGLFGYACGEIKNLRLINVNITGGDYSYEVGGLVGLNCGSMSNCSSSGAIESCDNAGGLAGDNQGSISNCSSSVVITGGYNPGFIGGLVGFNSNGIIIDSFSTGDISGGNESFYVGGLVGDNEGDVNNCYSTGSVTGGDDSYQIGGLVGDSLGGSISNSYSSGNVTGGSNSSSVGGLVGDNDSNIFNCHSIGKVIAGDDSSYIGGLIGIDFKGSINICFATGGVLVGNNSDDIGGLIGYTDKGNVDNCYSTSTVTAGDDSSSIGGLVGDNDANIINCYSTGAVVSGVYSDEVGGLVGAHYHASISHCFSLSFVTGMDDSRALGGLVGYNYYGTISDCNATGNIVGGDNSDHLGGLVGENDSNIINCFSIGSVSGGVESFGLGGLVGLTYQGGISSCFATGAVTGGIDSSDLGGLVGYTDLGRISNCFSTGAVTSETNTDNIGGLVGIAWEGNINNCYSTGTVTGGDDSYDVGGLVGYYDEGNVQNSYFLDTSGPNNGYGQPLPDAQMKQQASFAGWDFVDETVNGPNDFWTISEGVNYPTLRALGTSSKYSGGTGTADDPYQIADVNDLLALAAEKGDYDANFILTADIDLSSQNFTTAVIAPDTNPIGRFDGNSFTGVFDGAGHKIINLTINTGGAKNDYLGLFGYVDSSGKIKNIRLENITITGGDNSLGGLAGDNDGNISDCCSTGAITGGNDSDSLGGLVGENGSNISDCYSTVTVTGGNNTEFFGGLVGSNGGNISDCYSTGAVTGGDTLSCLGGLVGYNRSIISNCYSTSTVTGSYSLGGLVGVNFGGNISECYSTGAVTGVYTVGGLVGSNSDGRIFGFTSTGTVFGPDNLSYLSGPVGVNYGGSISNCYSTGAVTGSDSSAYIGGLVGENSGFASISYCYSACQVTAGWNSYDIGGLVGSNSGNINNSYFLKGSSPGNNFGEPLTYLQMKQQASFPGWDFSNVWQINEGVGYPEFAWQPYTEPSSGYVLVTKCVVAAGRKAGSDTIALSGEMYPTYDDLYLTNFIQIFIGSNDMDYPCVILIPTPNNEGYKKTGKYSYSGADGYGGRKSFTFDFKTHQFSLVAQNINLSGLSCALNVGVDITDYSASTSVDETIVNGPTKRIPINFLMGVRDSVRVDKIKVKPGSKKSSDTLTVSGSFSAQKADVNMAAGEFSVTLGSQTFTIPAKSFKPNKTKTKFTCSNVKLQNGLDPVGIASAAFDFKKCTFTLTIKKASIDANPGDAADLTIGFADFSENAEVLIP